MRAVLALSIVMTLAACADEDDSDRGPELEVPATCPSDNVEICLYRDGAWTVDCEYGNVTLRDESSVGYCAPGKHDVLCETPPKGPEILMACDNGCSDEVKLFDTYDEYQHFDPASLCL
jgi:hypothetical protein